MAAPGNRRSMPPPSETGNQNWLNSANCSARAVESQRLSVAERLAGLNRIAAQEVGHGHGTLPLWLKQRQ